MEILYKGNKADYLHYKNSEIFLQKLRKNPEYHFASSEENSFKSSYSAISSVLHDSEIPDNITVVAEYRLKIGAFRIDYVLTGFDEKRNSRAIIIEMKQWSNDGISQSSNSKDLIYVKAYGTDVVHPCYQAWSYKIMLENYNAAVQDKPVDISSCAFLPNYESKIPDILRNESFAAELKEAKLYDWSQYDDLTKLIKSTFKYGDNFEVYDSINTSEIRPSKSLQNAVGDMLKGNPAFTLVDSQKVVFEKAKNLVKLGMIDQKKRLYLIHGGPGTGKSVIAVNLMAQLLIEGIDSSHFRESKENIKEYSSASMPSPKEKNHIAVYCPYVTKTEAPRDVYEALLTMHSATGQKWTKKDVAGLFIGAGKFRIKPQHPSYAGLIIDESHRLKNTDRFCTSSSYVENVILSTYTPIVFLDDRQRISTEDYCTTQVIKEVAEKYGYELIEDTLSAQFRCGGADEYISFVDAILYSKGTVPIRKLFSSYDFRVFDNPEELHQAIIERNNNRSKGGLPSKVSAGYCWNWISKKNKDAFDIVIKDSNGSLYSRKWNKQNTKSPFAISDEDVDRVGCIHTTQGLEFEYAGVIIGPDLRLENGVLIKDISKRAKTDSSKNNTSLSNKATFEEIIQNTYWVLMTRGQKGCYVYCVDKNLNNYLKSLCYK